MKVLPQLLFIFRSLTLLFPKKLLGEIQRLFDTFVWAGKKTRVKNSIVQQRRMQGSLAIPNIALYHQAALVESLMEWQNRANIESWEIEQLNIKMLLMEWALRIRIKPSNFILAILWQFSEKISFQLIAGVFPLATFLLRPLFQETQKYDTYDYWKRKGLLQFCNLGRGRQMQSSEFILLKNQSEIPLVQRFSTDVFGL